MRSAVFFTAAFAAAVMASPLDARDEVIVTDVDITYVTDIITVTAGQVPATEAAVQPAATSAAPAPAYNGGGWRKHRHSKKPKPSQAPAPSSQAPAPSSSGPVGYPTVAPQPTSAPAPAPAPSTYSPPAPAPAPTTSVAPAPAPSSSQAPAPAPSAPASGYQALAVAHHNVHRANYSSPTIAWDDTLAAAAQQIGQTCVYGHSMGVNGLSYGQNIAVGSDDIAKIISDQFYNNEVDAYVSAIGGVYGTEVNMGNFEAFGHMTQVVWAGSTKVGCATVTCDQLANAAGYPPIFTVCNYSPAGNMVGDFHNNIGNCKDQPIVVGSDAVSA